MTLLARLSREHLGVYLGCEYIHVMRPTELPCVFLPLCKTDSYRPMFVRGPQEASETTLDWLCVRCRRKLVEEEAENGEPGA